MIGVVHGGLLAGAMTGDSPYPDDVDPPFAHGSLHGMIENV